MQPLSVESFFKYLTVLTTNVNNVETVITFIDSVKLEDRDKYVYATKQLLDNDKLCKNECQKKYNMFLSNLYYLFATDIMNQIIEQFDPQEFTNTFDTNILTSSYGNFIAELLSNDKDVSTLKRKLIDQLVNDISITQLIQYIRTIAMTMKVTKSNLDTVKSAMIAKNLNEKYPKLFEITCEGIPEQIHLMNSELWYNSFTQLIAKILSNQ